MSKKRGFILFLAKDESQESLSNVVNMPILADTEDQALKAFSLTPEARDLQVIAIENLESLVSYEKMIRDLARSHGIKLNI